MHKLYIQTEYMLDHTWFKKEGEKGAKARTVAQWQVACLAFKRAPSLTPQQHKIAYLLLYLIN